MKTMKPFWQGLVGSMAGFVIMAGLGFTAYRSGMFGDIFQVEKDETVVMRVTDTGNVGIGHPAPAPGSRLEVQGTGTTSSTSALNVTDSTGASRLFVRDDGNVGIGTTAPRAPLHVGDGSDVGSMTGVAGHIKATSALYNTGISARRDGFSEVGMTTGNRGYIGTFTNHGIEFFVNGSANSRMSIDTAGNVGIGTTGPGAKLEVSDGTAPNATCDGNTWTNACSREAKEGIRKLGREDYEKLSTQLKEIDPVWYRYKGAQDKRLRVGLIAEEMPEELATPDQKGISTADAIGFLMAVVKQQQTRIEALEAELNRE